MQIDKNSDIPIYRQIYDSITEEIVSGYMSAGEKLKPRRVLCAELGISPQTVESAYQRLVSDGYIVAKHGSGYYVSTDRVWDDEYKVMQSCIYNFSSNGVETSKMPFAEWSRLIRSTIRDDTSLFQHGEKAGEWCLRKSIRRFLFRAHGIRCNTNQIVIGPGAEDLLRMIFNIFAYDSAVLMNNNFNYRVNEAAIAGHSRVHYLYDDENGIATDELMKFDAGVLYQKPTHNLPTGVTLDEKKRMEIVNWLGENRYAVEDSSENDFIYTVPQKTLWELSGGKNVIYLGSFSGTIAPSMKIGYAVMPKELVDKWFSAMQYYSCRVSRVEQVALSKFIDRGHYERHIGYMKSIYHEKSMAVCKALENSALNSCCTIGGADAGLFIRAHFELDCPEDKAQTVLAENGVKLSTLTSSLWDKSRPGFKPNTYVIGYGDMTISRIREGIDRIEKIWKDFSKVALL